MENKLVKNMTSALLVLAMVMSIITIPVLTGDNTVNAATLDSAKKQCSLNVSPTIRINTVSNISLVGYNVNGTTADVKIVPYSVKVYGNYYNPKYQYFSSAPYNTTALIEYPDNYKVTATYRTYTYDASYSTKWRSGTDYVITKNYNVKPQLVLNANKGKISKKSKITKTYEITSSLKSLPKPTRKGFKFTGWYTSKKGYSSEKVGTGSYLIIRNLYYRNTTSKTVYAQWKKKIKVKFNANGGKVSKKSKKVTYVSNSLKKSYGKLPTPKRGGKYFMGWYTKKKGGKRIASYSDVTKTKNHTVYARWI